MKDIDEAIKHCEAVAEVNERSLRVYENLDEDRPLFKEEENECKECAKEHRQLAEWLKELKAYRKIRRILSQNRIATDRYGEVVLWDDIKRVIKEIEADETDN